MVERGCLVFRFSFWCIGKMWLVKKSCFCYIFCVYEYGFFIVIIFYDIFEKFSLIICGKIYFLQK